MDSSSCFSLAFSSLYHLDHFIFIICTRGAAVNRTYTRVSPPTPTLRHFIRIFGHFVHPEIQETLPFRKYITIRSFRMQFFFFNHISFMINYISFTINHIPFKIFILKNYLDSLNLLFSQFCFKWETFNSYFIILFSFFLSPVYVYTHNTNFKYKPEGLKYSAVLIEQIITKTLSLEWFWRIWIIIFCNIILKLNWIKIYLLQS